MQVAVNQVSGNQAALRPVDSIDSGRKDLEKAEPKLEQVSAGESSNVQPEEIVNKIKGLTENGAYSVQFEAAKDTEELVVKVIDQQTGDVIRQVPSEEVLGIKASLSSFRGNIVNAEG